MGPHWSYRVDPGSSEDGYRGNGTPAMARDPQEVVGALTPLGCRPVILPTPKSALEVTYGHRDGTPAVGLLLEFESSDVAADFFDRRSAALRDCVDWKRATAEIDVLRDETDSFVSVRDEQVGGTPVWTEGVKRSETRVMFVAVAGADGQDVVESALRTSS